MLCKVQFYCSQAPFCSGIKIAVLFFMFSNTIIPYIVILSIPQYYILCFLAFYKTKKNSKKSSYTTNIALKSDSNRVILWQSKKPLGQNIQNSSVFFSTLSMRVFFAFLQIENYSLQNVIELFFSFPSF